ncbi:unnamed protein product [Linum trigynum]|uniref:Uncharacterized protein n=1 Tax=Linum trigynum TaxID=586398 RepID=A0AAV2GBR9_9ROSI
MVRRILGVTNLPSPSKFPEPRGTPSSSSPMTSSALFFFAGVLKFMKLNEVTTKFTKKDNSLQPQGVAFEVLSGTLRKISYFNFQALNKATKNFHADNLLGRGGFGPVYWRMSPETFSPGIRLTVPFAIAGANDAGEDLEQAPSVTRVDDYWVAQKQRVSRISEAAERRIPAKIVVEKGGVAAESFSVPSSLFLVVEDLPKSPSPRPPLTSPPLSSTRNDLLVGELAAVAAVVAILNRELFDFWWWVLGRRKWELIIMETLEDAWREVVARSPQLQPVDVRAEEFIHNFRADMKIQKARLVLEKQSLLPRRC